MTNMEEDEKNEEESRAVLPPHTTTTAASNRCSSCTLSSTVTAKQSDAVVVCSGCQKPIYDQYYMWVDKRSWHESCVQCSTCGRLLAKTCYMKNRKLYCHRDYERLQKCRRCRRVISFNEYVLQVGGLPYHVNCFVCDFCHNQLQSGDQYLVHESTNQIVCKSCYANGDDPFSVQYLHDEIFVSDSERSDDEVFPHHAMTAMGHMTGYVTSGGLQAAHGLLRSKNGSKSTSSLSMMTPSCDGKRVKRPRTILTTAQRRKFKASFEVSQKPCRKVRETLAAETGLSPRVVQVWFQNQRAKMKKLARRQQGDGSGQGGAKAGGRLRRKKTTDSDSDNDAFSSPGSYTPLSTPLQNQIFSDSYRSPGSIQTSPTTSTSEVNPGYPHPPTSNHELPEMMYDDIFTTSDAYMTQAPYTVTSSTLSSSLHPEVGHHGVVDEYVDQRHQLLLDSDSMALTSPHGSFQQFGGSQQHVPPIPGQGHDGTPIDRLMYMQDSYFRT